MNMLCHGLFIHFHGGNRDYSSSGHFLLGRTSPAEVAGSKAELIRLAGGLKAECGKDVIRDIWLETMITKIRPNRIEHHDSGPYNLFRTAPVQGFY